MLRISTVVDTQTTKRHGTPLEVLRISTVVDVYHKENKNEPLEVLRISTVVDFTPGMSTVILWKC